MKRYQLTQVLLFFLAAIVVQADDLPFDSGSDGSDGAFSIPIVPGYDSRSAHVAVYDAARDEVVVFGGWKYADFGNSIDRVQRLDAIGWNGVGWRLIKPNLITSYSSQEASGYDYGSQKVVLYGGVEAGGDMSHNTITYDGSSWEVNNQSLPGNTRLGRMAYDHTTGELLMYGGFFNNNSGLAETWVFDSASDNWTLKNTLHSPPGLYAHAMCWDASREVIVLMGGWIEDQNRASNETWIFDPTAQNWVQQFPAHTPPVRAFHSMGYDPGSGKVICFGGFDGTEILGDTWEWDGVDWTNVSSTSLPARKESAMATYGSTGKLLLFGGEGYEYGTEGDSWRWDGDGKRWVQESGSRYWFDTNERADGRWDYSSVNVAGGYTVEFIPNSNNTPVRWLVSGQVTVSGSLSVSGRTGFVRPNLGKSSAPGGAGAYEGGIGATAGLGQTAGFSGGGPAGGSAGITVSSDGVHGLHAAEYGNVYGFPMSGGSGGGGGASDETADGGVGGGGGGAIMIASSEDILINGSIIADGGIGGCGSDHQGSLGGSGAGGYIKLVADRIIGTGHIRAAGGDGLTTNGRGGYIRLEAYDIPFRSAGITAGKLSQAPPLRTPRFAELGSLAVTQISNAVVPQPAGGDPSNPDAIIEDDTSVMIEVTATGIPDGAAVSLRVTNDDGTFVLPETGDPDVILTDGVAVFSVSLAAGVGSVQAFARYEIDSDSF